MSPIMQHDMKIFHNHHGNESSGYKGESLVCSVIMESATVLQSTTCGYTLYAPATVSFQLFLEPFF